MCAITACPWGGWFNWASIKSDTVATLQSQGVTGVSFVALSGGSADAALLPENSTIVAQPSPLQSVLEGAPVLLQRAVDLLEDLNEIANAENRAAVTQILTNLSSASGRFDRALSDFESLSADLSTSATAVAGFATRLDALADSAESTLDAATETLTEGRAVIAQGGAVLEGAGDTLNEAESAFASATKLMDGDLARFIRQGILPDHHLNRRNAFDEIGTLLQSFTGFIFHTVNNRQLLIAHVNIS